MSEPFENGNWIKTVVAKTIVQVPSMVVLSFIVWMFLDHIDSSQAILTDCMQSLSNRNVIESVFIPPR